MKLYLDNCCYNRPFDDQSLLTIRLESEAKLHIQKLILDGQYQLVWSYILDFENAANPMAERRTEIQRWELIAEQYITESTALLTNMNNYTRIGIKPLDALHIACAAIAGCDYFLTVDKGLLRKAKLVPDVQILNPLDFVVEQGQ